MKKIVVLIFFAAISQIFSQTSSGKLEKVFSDGFFTEGPVSTDDGKIFFTDLTFTSETDLQAGNIWLYDANTGKTILYRSPSGMANGLEIYKVIITINISILLMIWYSIQKGTYILPILAIRDMNR